MKKSCVLVFIFVCGLTAANAQKVSLTWVKKIVTNPEGYLGSGIRHPIWYPQVSGCQADDKINRWLQKSALMWSDYNYEGKSGGERYAASGTVAVTKNDGHYLILYLRDGWENPNRANEHEYYVRFNLKTGAVQEKTVNYDQANWDNSGW
jgi:hypothetical protein